MGSTLSHLLIDDALGELIDGKELNVGETVIGHKRKRGVFRAQNGVV